MRIASVATTLVATALLVCTGATTAQAAHGSAHLSLRSAHVTGGLGELTQQSVASSGDSGNNNGNG